MSFALRPFDNSALKGAGKNGVKSKHSAFALMIHTKCYRAS